MSIDLTLDWATPCLWIFAGVFILQQLFGIIDTERLLRAIDKSQQPNGEPGLHQKALGIASFLVIVVIAFDNWQTAIVLSIAQYVVGSLCTLLIGLYLRARFKARG